MRPPTRISIMLLCVSGLVASACGSSASSGDQATDQPADQAVPSSVAFDQPPSARSGTSDPSAGCTATAPAPTSTMGATFRSGDKDRIYNLTVPTEASDRAQPLPLVVNLHGATGTARGQDLGTGFPELAETDDFVLLTPEAEEPGRFFDTRDGSADRTFVDDLIDQTTSALCIDLNRVYLVGFSLGGMMSMSFACAEPERFAAIAVVGGIFDPPDCARDTPVPMVVFHGTADDVVRADGSYSPYIALALGTGGPTREQLAAAWATANGCSADPPVEATQGPVTELTFACPTGSEVDFYRIDGGTHAWPGGRPVGYITGNPSPTDGAINATQTIWDFFTAFQR